MHPLSRNVPPSSGQLTLGSPPYWLSTSQRSPLHPSTVLGLGHPTASERYPAEGRDRLHWFAAHRRGGYQIEDPC